MPETTSFGLDPARVLRCAPLAPFTTFRVGGPADWLVLASSSDEVRNAHSAARRAGIPVTIIGGGSNVLVSDEGIRGVVIRVHGGHARLIGEGIVRADAGLTINGLVRWTIGRGAAGLEAWAGTPGTVGGAVYGNAHFMGRLIGELVDSVELLGVDGDTLRVSASEMEFAYDLSRLQRTREVLLCADIRVGRGEPAALRAIARQSLAYRKGTQPLESASAGCIFQNPTVFDRVPAGIPLSAGALIDRAGLKGVREGGAVVSPSHGNFIVNDGTATAADIRRLIERCRGGVRERFGVELRDEIVYLGWSSTHG